ncbi:TPA: DUF935 domain-containing protein, partial [Pasteurella multocida]|nr:DUF935 family protein [Pasteurella multocida]
HDKLQVPIASDDEPILERKTVSEPTALLSAQHKPKQRIAVLSATRDPDDLLDELEPSAEQYQEVIDPMLKPVVEALQTGGYELAQERIATLYADLDDSAFEQLLTRAIFVSDLLGRLNGGR